MIRIVLALLLVLFVVGPILVKAQGNFVAMQLQEE